jgi:hypothetical protein
VGQSRNMPSRRQIYRYWKNRLLERSIEIGDDDTCFACGDVRHLERAHIKTRMYEGKDSVENIHVLCKPCHIESEYFSETAYWNWLKYKNQNEWKLSILHVLSRLQKAGFSLEKFNELHSQNQKDVACEYLSSFYEDADGLLAKLALVKP